jgi:hypothetical protein
MSSPTGRGDQRVRSWGRARKREEAGRLLGKRGSGGKVVSIIGVLLSKDSTGCGNMMVNGRKHKVVEKTCQYNSLDESQRRREAGIHQRR